MAPSRLTALRVAAAAVLHPALRRLLLFDPGPEDLETIAESLERLLEAATGAPVHRITLAPFHDEDDLWGFGEGLPVAWRRPGLLVSPDNDPAWRLVVVPDLSTLSLPAARACIQLLETDLGRLERHGRSRIWTPRLAWLAACPSQAVGQVSTHLLDRFPVRLQAAAWRSERPGAGLRSWLEGAPSEAPELPEVPEMVRSLPPLAPHGIEAVIDLLSAWESPGVRRHLGLARLAQALAALDGAGEALPAHVEEAAGLMGIAALRSREPEAAPPSVPAPETEPARPIEPDRMPRPEIAASTASTGPAGMQGGGGEPASVFETLEPPADQGRQDVDLSPFPEDRAPVEHFPEALQLPRRDVAGRARRGGAAVGVSPTSDPAELALVPTLFAAAPYQVFRRRLSGRTDSHLRITAADWRARRRARRPEDLLVLVLDLTAREGCDWPAALIPHVRNAYVRRSAVCVVLVGAREARHELRAEKILARSILDPDVLAAFEREPGRATPLASGLQLALEAIRDAQHRGRGSVLRATLVVLTDGRGNVPLSASRAGQLSGSVAGEGVADALEVGSRLGALDRVESILLDPQPVHGRDLVGRLAEALGARIEPVPVNTEAAS